MIRGVRPRRLAAVLGLIVVLAVVAGIVLLLGRSAGPIADRPFPRESTATVLYVGQFPAEDEPALLGPIGIGIRDDTLFVAESDAGRVSLFALDGSARGAIALPVASGAPSAYPSDLAMLGEDRLVVVDNAGLRVLVLAADPKADSPLLGIVGEGSPASRPLQPTAVAVGTDEIFVADAGDRTIKVYAQDGTFARVIAKDLDQALTFVGGMVVVGGELFVTDSNAGRVLVLDVRTGALKRTFPDARVLPRGVCAGRDNGVLVADTFERTVLLLSTKGSVLDEIMAASGGSLGSPRDVAWSEAKTQAYVTDAGTGRVMVYRMRPSPE